MIGNSTLNIDPGSLTLCSHHPATCGLTKKRRVVLQHLSSTNTLEAKTHSSSGGGPSSQLGSPCTVSSNSVMWPPPLLGRLRTQISSKRQDHYIQLSVYSVTMVTARQMITTREKVGSYMKTWRLWKGVQEPQPVPTIMGPSLYQMAWTEGPQTTTGVLRATSYAFPWPPSAHSVPNRCTFISWLMNKHTYLYNCMLYTCDFP